MIKITGTDILLKYIFVDNIVLPETKLHKQSSRFGQGPCQSGMITSFKSKFCLIEDTSKIKNVFDDPDYILYDGILCCRFVLHLLKCLRPLLQMFRYYPDNAENWIAITFLSATFMIYEIVGKRRTKTGI